MRLILFITTVVFFFCAAEIYTQNKSGAKPKDDVSDIVVKDIDGNKVKLSDYKGKVLMIVNIASKCGHTPQMKQLQQLYTKYKDQGFEILAFPSNDFNQEPLNNEEIKEFCSQNYGVTFKIMDKVKVTGKDKLPLFERLINNPVDKGEIKWNFEKFIVSKTGKVIHRLRTHVTPMDEVFWIILDEELAK